MNDFQQEAERLASDVLKHVQESAYGDNGSVWFTNVTPILLSALTAAYQRGKDEGLEALAKVEEEIKRLDEYKWRYEELCK